MKRNQLNPFTSPAHGWHDQEEQQQQEGPAVAAPPAAAAPPAPSKIADYVPDIPDVEAILRGDPPKPPAAAPTVPPASTPPPSTETPPPASGTPPVDAEDPFAFIEQEEIPPVIAPGETPPPAAGETAEQIAARAEANKGLRQQLEAANARLKQLESGESIREQQARLAEAMERNKTLETQLYTRDPLSHPEVVELRNEMANKFGAVVRKMTFAGEDATGLQAFLQKAMPALVNAGDPNGTEYMKVVRSLRDEIKDEYKPESVSAILELADQGVDNTRRTHAKVQDITTNWGKYEAKQAREQHEKIATEWANVRKAWINPTPDQMENDPYNPAVFLAKAAGEDPKLKAAFDQTAKSLVATFMPLAPIMPEDLSGMEENEIANYLENREQKHRKAMDGFRGQVGNMAAFYRMGPGILRKLKQLEDELADFKGATPVPGETRQPGGGGGGPPAQSKIADYDPGPLPVV